MPTYIDNYAHMGSDPHGFQHGAGGPNCRQIFEHVQGCPVCQQVFGVLPPPKSIHVMQQQRPPFIAQHNFMGATRTSGISISPTIAFLVVTLIVILLVYMIRNLSN